MISRHFRQRTARLVAATLGLSAAAVSLAFPSHAQASTEATEHSPKRRAPLALESLRTSAQPESAGEIEDGAAAPAEPTGTTDAGAATDVAPSAESPPSNPGASTTVAPAQEVAPVPGSATEPPTSDSEGPEADDYTSSKASGKALSGQETSSDDGMPENRETVGKVKEKRKDLTHHKTGMIGVAIGAGWGMIITGDKFCGEFSEDEGDSDNRKGVCTGMRPLALDITAGFGAAPRLDVVMSVRISLMKRKYDFSECDSEVEPCDAGKGLFNKSVAIGVMPGVRIWGKDNDKLFKVGGAIDFLYLYENFDGYRARPRHAEEDADPVNAAEEKRVGDHSIGLRGGAVFQIDPHHNIGIAIMPAVVPLLHVEGPAWVEIGFEGSIGFQARFP